MFEDESKLIYSAVQNSSKDNVIKNINKAVDNNKSNWEKEFESLYIAIIKIFGEDTFKKLLNIKANTKFDVWSNDIIDFIQHHTAEQVSHIRGTTKDRLKYMILKGLDEGKTVQEMAKDIRKWYGHFSESRALTIATTEVSSISNYGSLMGAWQSGKDVLKSWVNVGDEIVRNSHIDMDIHPAIELDEYFQVGNSLMQYPGDPNGSSDEIVNCRCSLMYIDKNGAIAA